MPRVFWREKKFGCFWTVSGKGWCINCDVRVGAGRCGVVMIVLQVVVVELRNQGERMVVWRFWGGLTGFDRGGLFKTV